MVGAAGACGGAYVKSNFISNSSLHVSVALTPCLHPTACFHSTSNQCNGFDSLLAPHCVFAQHQGLV
jgi:hypothetical protein